MKISCNRKIIVLAGLGFLCLLFSSSTVWGAKYDQEVEELNAKIKAQRDQIQAIQERQKQYSDMINQKRQEKADLNNQLAIIENRLSKSQLDIDSTVLEIQESDLEIKKINVDLENISRSIERQKEQISGLLKLMYRQDQVSTLEMLLTNNSLAEFLDQAKYLANTNEKVSDSLNDLRQSHDQLENNQKALKQKNDQLVLLKKQLEEKKSGLQYEQENKVFILDETNSSEREYQALLQKAKKEQAQISAEIASLEKAVRDKLAKSAQRIGKDSTIVWPITKNIITSTFHDPDYPFRNSIGEHPAIDIKSPQGSPLRAAADGYVARVKFDGTRNYAYIMIIHENGLSTVYGHVSAVSVSADEYVKKGQLIGRTGGMPGSAGSGPFSTGAHLHFEVRKNGIPVNPLEYLP